MPLSQSGSEPLFDVFSRRYENGATIVTSNLPFQEWTSVFARERLTGALLDRIAHHVCILEMNGESYRLKQSRSRSRTASDRPRLPVVQFYSAALAHGPAAVDTGVDIGGVSPIAPS